MAGVVFGLWSRVLWIGIWFWKGNAGIAITEGRTGVWCGRNARVPLSLGFCLETACYERQCAPDELAFMSGLNFLSKIHF